jgi:hypothetical protein
MWLHGPAGSGKSTIAHTIAKWCDESHPRSLAFSYFFSRRNPDRNDLKKFIPTFAHQLISIIPSLDQGVREAAQGHAIFKRSLRDQIDTLIVLPLQKFPGRIPPMIVVIDGLDEYSEETGKLPLWKLIQVLLNALTSFPFQFFFASRPEPYIHAIFEGPTISSRIMTIPLKDWETDHDVYSYLSAELSKVQRTKGLPPSWPSEADLYKLVSNSEGIFIYVSTVVKFVGARNCNADKRLQEVIKSHKGLDPLFKQVLDNAAEHEDLRHILNFVFFMQKTFSIGKLSQFLLCSSYHIRSALEGTLSILLVPDRDDDYIRPYHASLQDFLTDCNRSGNHFLDFATAHRALFDQSCTLVLGNGDSNTHEGEHVFYACRYWCHHLYKALPSVTYTNHNGSHFQVRAKELIDRSLAAMSIWLPKMQSHKEVEGWLQDLRVLIDHANVRRL